MNTWLNLGIQLWAAEDYPDTLATDSSNTTTASTVEYSLPTDYLKVLGVRVGDASTTTEVDATEYSFIRYENKNLDTIGPSYYINPINSKVGLIPTPTTTGLPIYIKYHAAPTEITSTTTISTYEPPFPKAYHEAVIYFALKKYWETQDEFDKSIYYDTEWRNMLEMMKTDLKKQSRGQLGAMRDIRDLQRLNQPWQRNSFEN